MKLANYLHKKEGNWVHSVVGSVNHAGFDDVEKNSLDNDCHHKKGGECEKRKKV